MPKTITDTRHPLAVRSRRVRRLVLLAVAIAVGLTAYIGARRTPTGSATGGSFQGNATGTASTFRTTLRVGTFNIDGGRGGDGKVDLNRTAAQMKGCDFLGLTEVKGSSLTEARDQAQILGEKMEMLWEFFPTERRWWRDDYGNAALSRLPVTHWQRTQISPPHALSNRNMSVSTLALGDKMLRVVVTHLGKHKDHAQELTEAISTFLSLESPAILMGDFNISDADPQITKLKYMAGVIDAIGTLPEKDRAGHVDWIFLRGLHCVKAGIEDNAVSDHPFYWADVALDKD